MRLEQPIIILGAALYPSEPLYTGRHRNNNMLRGVGFIPLGDRDRVKPEYNGIEERDSIDRYSKYYT